MYCFSCSTSCPYPPCLKTEIGFMFYTPAQANVNVCNSIYSNLDHVSKVLIIVFRDDNECQQCFFCVQIYSAMLSMLFKMFTPLLR